MTFFAAAVSNLLHHNNSDDDERKKRRKVQQTLDAFAVEKKEVVKENTDQIFEELNGWLKEIEARATIALQKQNPISVFDDFAIFNVGPHTYEVSDADAQGNVYILTHRGSCTGFIHTFFPHFDSARIIMQIVSSSRWRIDKSYKYFELAQRKGIHDLIEQKEQSWPPEKTDECLYDWCAEIKTIFAQTIKTEWKHIADDASSKGTSMHAYIEAFYNGFFYDKKTPKEMGLEFVQFHKFHCEQVEDKNLEPFRTELTLFDRRFELSGQIDMLFREKNRPADGSRDFVLHMYDWKRSKSIEFASFTKKEFGRGPCHDQQNCNFEHYSIQLNLYAEILRTYTRYTVETMHLGVFHPNQGFEYQCIPVRDMRAKIVRMCEFRRHNLVKADIANVDQMINKIGALELLEKEQKKEVFDTRICEFAKETKQRWMPLYRMLHNSCSLVATTEKQNFFYTQFDEQLTKFCVSENTLYDNRAEEIAVFKQHWEIVQCTAYEILYSSWSTGCLKTIAAESDMSRKFGIIEKEKEIDFLHE